MKKSISFLLMLILLVSMGCVSSAEDVQLGESIASVTEGTLLGGDEQAPESGGGTLETAEEASSGGVPELVNYDLGYMSILMPRGWAIEIKGEYTGISFKIWDPADPSTQVFYYGDLAPYHKSEASRQVMARSNAILAIGPVLPSADIIGILDTWAEAVAAQKSINNLLYTELYSIRFKGGSYYESGIFSDLGVKYTESGCFVTCATNWDSDCYLTIMAGLVDFDRTGIYNGNMYYNCQGLYGILAPAARYAKVFDALQECLKSIQFSSAYIAASKRQNNPMASQSVITARSLVYTAILKALYQTYGQ